MQTAMAWITTGVDRLLKCYVIQPVSIDHTFNAELFQSFESLVTTPLSATHDRRWFSRSAVLNNFILRGGLKSEG